MENTDRAALAPDMTPPPPVPFATASHTQEHPTRPPHTQTKSTLKTPDEFTRIVLLGWAARYVPRGALGMFFESSGVPFIKRLADKFINATRLNHTEKQINTLLNDHQAMVQTAKAAGTAETSPLLKKLTRITNNWHLDKSVASHIVTQAVEKNGGYALGKAQKTSLRTGMRNGYLAIGYSAAMFIGSSLLSLRYGRLVRSDITNLFRESVAYERGIPQEAVTFDDIKQSDNRIVCDTLANYHSKLRERLTGDALFLFSAPMKSMYATDFVLGLKGVQMFRDTWQRESTMFEDLITFVNNKINPMNGLGQPVTVGEVFDLYQHYAQAHAPDRAFQGVIEHAKSEGARWADNQPIFQRMAELLNKTYAYKHQSVVDPTTGLSQLQADFPLPKFIYLLGHDLIDVNNPEQTRLTIELANAYGIASVKEVHALLKQGKTMEEATVRYPLAHFQGEATPGEIAALYAAPTIPAEIVPRTHIAASSVQTVAPLTTNATHAALM